MNKITDGVIVQKYHPLEHLLLKNFILPKYSIKCLTVNRDVLFTKNVPAVIQSYRKVPLANSKDVVKQPSRKEKNSIPEANFTSSIISALS